MKLHYKYQLIILGVLFFPFLIISFYNVPSADDFVRTNVDSISLYFSLINEWYHDQNGRYFNALISFIPIWYIPYVYSLLFVFFSSFFTYSIYRLLKVVFHNENRKQLILSSLFIVAFFLIYIPKIVSAFYWLAGLTAYLFSFSIYLLLLGNLLKIIYSKESAFKLSTSIYIFILVFIGCGSHEVTMVIIDFTLFLFLIFIYFKKQERKKFLFFSYLNAFAFLCSMLVYFAPGSKKRMAWQGIERSYFVSFENSFITSLNYIYKQIFMTPIFLVSTIFLILYFASYTKKYKPKFTVNPLIIGLIVFAFVLIPSFIYYHSVGHFSITYAHRTLNLLSFYFVLVWIFFIYNLIASVQKRHTALYTSLVNFNFITPFLLFYILFSSLLSENYKNAVSDWWKDTAKNYNTFWNLRTEYVKNYDGKDTILYLPKIPNPSKILFFDDITTDETHWKNDFFVSYTNSSKKIAINTNLFLASYLKKREPFQKIDNTFDVFILTKEQIDKDKLLPLKSRKQLILFVLNKVDLKSKFFLHIYPKQKNKIKKGNFNNFDFNWGKSKKMKSIQLPEYEIAKIRIGQFDSNGIKWQKTYLLNKEQQILKLVK